MRDADVLFDVTEQAHAPFRNQSVWFCGKLGGGRGTGGGGGGGTDKRRQLTIGRSCIGKDCKSALVTAPTLLRPHSGEQSRVFCDPWSCPHIFNCRHPRNMDSAVRDRTTAWARVQHRTV